MDNPDNLPAVQGQLISPPSDLKPVTGLCSPGLRKLLMEGEDGGGAYRLISLNKVLRAECEAVLPVLQAAKAPATDGELLEILVRYAPTYGITAPGPGGWMLFFAAYLDALEELPAFAVEDGFIRWNRGEGHANLQMAGFYPKPGQLFTLAIKGKASLYTAAFRAERALAYAEKKAAAAPPPPEVRKQMGANLADLLGELKGSRRVEDPFRPRMSPQQMAQAIREAAAAPKPAEPDDDVGDVL